MRGFTLIELVMVIVVVGVIAIYAAPRFDRSGFEAAQAREELKEALRYAQEMSMVRTASANYQVVIDAAGFTVQQAGAVAVPDPFTGAASYSRAGMGITAGSGTITFDNRGDPGLAADHVVTITGAPTLTVEPITGYVH